MQTCIIDCETASLAKLTGKNGLRTPAFIEHESTKVVVVSMKEVGNPEVFTWVWGDPYGGNEAAQDFYQRNRTGLWVAHNAMFESFAIPKWSRHCRMPEWELGNLRCTQTMCRLAAIPESLSDSAKFLDLDALKDEDGKQLIKVFSGARGYNWLVNGLEYKSAKQHPKINKIPTTPEECLRRYALYCDQDIRTTEKLAEKLKYFWPRGDTRELWRVDLEMNHRGIPLDVPAITHAIEICSAVKAERIEEMKEATKTDDSEGLSPTQTAKLLAWLQERGWTRTNLQKATIEDSLANDEDLHEDVVAALELRAGAAFAALSKLDAMQRMKNSDRRVRAGFKWCGAVRTRRTAGSGFQPQNFRRPTILHTEVVIEAIRMGCPVEVIEEISGNPLEAIASAIRHFIRAGEGFTFWDTDFSNIESRICLWLAGQEDMLQAYREGKDPYKSMASAIFRVPYEAVTKDQRFIGKMAVLLCGYQGGAEKFRESVKTQTGRDVGDEMASTAVGGFRASNPLVVQAWKEMGNAAVSALLLRPELHSMSDKAALAAYQKAMGKPRLPGPVEACKGRIRFDYRSEEECGVDTLMMILPNGVELCYPRPRLIVKKGQRKLCKICKAATAAGEKPNPKCECREVFTSIGLTYVSRDKSHRFIATHTYGGKLYENACQAIAGQFLNHALLIARKEGYHPTMVIHDQAIGEIPEEHAGQAKQDIARIFTVVPPWAQGFPLGASCDIRPIYTKD